MTIESLWSDEAQVRIHPQVLLHPVEDEAVLLNLSSGVYYGLNAVGARMVQVMHQSATLGDAVDLLLREYDVDEAQLRADLYRLLDDMQGRGLITVER